MKTWVFALLLSTSLFAEKNPVITIEKEKDILENFQKNLLIPGSAVFTPPEGWRVADPESLPTHVKFMVVGSGSYDLPPSMTLTIDPFKGTLKQYLKIVKNYNDSQNAEWKDLGTISTKAGEASLSQVDTKTKWGILREMHLIIVKDQNAYILDAAAMKDEFSKFYKDFFQAMKSFRFNENKN